MNPAWTITVDCSDAVTLAAFWRKALGYVDAPPPPGFASRADWFRHFEVPHEESSDAAYLVDPEGLRPKITFLKVPEPKTVKNRLHLDLQVSGGRDQPQPQRERAIKTSAEELIASGATLIRRVDHAGSLDYS